MGIIDLQRRLAEVGRIRIGHQVPAGRGTRPAKLDTFRLTSSDHTRIVDAARLYGGTPEEWQAPSGKQWQVITTSTALDVIVPPGDMAFSQNYELWSAGGCQRRCDGVTEMLSDGPCLCDPDQRECSIHTRLSVLLRDLPGLGVWRLDTSGYYAAVELKGAVQLIRLAADRGQMLPARLRIEQRMVKRANEGAKRFAVPVLDIAITPAQLLAYGTPVMTGPIDAIIDGTSPQELPPPPVQPLLEPVPQSVPEWPTPSLQEQITFTDTPTTTRKRGQQPIPATGIEPRKIQDVPPSEVGENPVVVPGQRLRQDPAQASVDLPAPTEELPPNDVAQPEAGDLLEQIAEQEVTPGKPAPGPDTPMISPPQLKKLSVLLREKGLEDRADRHEFVEMIIERPIDSAKNLSKEEATLLIEVLSGTDTIKTEKAGQPS